MKQVEIGRLGKPHGLSGGLWFRAGEPGLLSYLDEVTIEGTGLVRLVELREMQGSLVVYFEGLSSREDAEAWVGRAVYANTESLPALEGGAYYYFQLIGMPVHMAGELVGEVADLIDNGAQDLLVVRHGSRTHLVPLQAPYVQVGEGEIQLEPIPGLLE